MPPRAQAQPKEQLDKQEDVLQAVVIADSYNQRFQPLTLDSPRVRLELPSTDRRSAVSSRLVRHSVSCLCVTCRCWNGRWRAWRSLA